MISILFLPMLDYIKTRRKIWWHYIIAIIPATVALIYTLVFNVCNERNIFDIFSSFVSVQISAIAILISFSIAIITILVTSDNDNIRQLKQTPASDKNYRPLVDRKSKTETKLNLFQILLSSITYNVIIQIIYLALLTFEFFSQNVVNIELLKYLASFDIFIFLHILITLLESVVNLYLVHWQKF